MYYCSSVLTETMCPSRSICQRMWVCLFISLGNLSMQSLRAPCSHTHDLAEVSGSSNNGCLATRWCPCSRHHPSRIGPWGPCRASGVRTAPSAVLGRISGAKEMLQLLHYKACVVHLCRKQTSFPFRAGGEKKLSCGEPSPESSPSTTCLALAQAT